MNNGINNFTVPEPRESEPEPEPAQSNSSDMPVSLSARLRIVANILNKVPVREGEYVAVSGSSISEDIHIQGTATVIKTLNESLADSSCIEHWIYKKDGYLMHEVWMSRYFRLVLVAVYPVDTKTRMIWKIKHLPENVKLQASKLTDRLKKE